MFVLFDILADCPRQAAPLATEQMAAVSLPFSSAFTPGKC